MSEALPWFWCSELLGILPDWNEWNHVSALLRFDGLETGGIKEAPRQVEEYDQQLFTRPSSTPRSLSDTLELEVFLEPMEEIEPLDAWETL